MKTKMIKVNGFKIHTRIDRSDQDQHVIDEVIKNDSYHLHKLKQAIPEPKVMLDVGGHIGTFGILSKFLFPNAHLIAVEPDKESFELYCMNMEENGYKNTKIINAAISYSSNKTYLMGGNSATGGGMMKTRQEAEVLEKAGRYHITYSDVRLITLEDILNPYESVGLAKWDCEGGEREAFANMLDETAKKFNYMVGEYHIQGGSSAFVDLVKVGFPNLITLPRRGLNHPAHIELFAIFPKDKVIKNYF